MGKDLPLLEVTWELQAEVDQHFPTFNLEEMVTSLGK